MKAVFLGVGCVAIALCGCATVDVTDMTSGQMSISQNTELQENIVLRSAKSLRQSLVEEGLAKDNSQRIMTAANMLLRGQNSSGSQPGEATYPEVGSGLEDIRADIVKISSKIEKTSQAAVLYLEMNEDNYGLQPELEALEGALMASLSARDTIGEAINSMNTDNSAEDMQMMNEAIQTLADATNAYGTGLRQARNETQDAPIF